MRRLYVWAALAALLALPCAATMPTTVVTFNAARPDGTYPPTVRMAWAKVTQTTSNDPRVVGTIWPGTYSPTTGKVTWTLPQNSEVMFNLPDYDIDQDTYSLGTSSTYTLNSLLAITPSTAPGWAGPLAPLLAIPAKGALLASTGAAWSSLAAGTNTYVLTADSAQTAGVKWAAPSWLPLAGGTMTGAIYLASGSGYGLRGTNFSAYEDTTTTPPYFYFTGGASMEYVFNTPVKLVSGGLRLDNNYNAGVEWGPGTGTNSWKFWLERASAPYSLFLSYGPIGFTDPGVAVLTMAPGAAGDQSDSVATFAGTVAAAGVTSGGSAVLTAESDTLDDVTGRGAETTNNITLTGASYISRFEATPGHYSTGTLTFSDLSFFDTVSNHTGQLTHETFDTVDPVWTLQKTSGTLAYTSQLANYLPLGAGSGAPLTGNFYIDTAQVLLIYMNETGLYKSDSANVTFALSNPGAGNLIATPDLLAQTKHYDADDVRPYGWPVSAANAKDDEFADGTLSGWTWRDAGGGSTTPGTVTESSFPSFLKLSHTSASLAYYWLHKAAAWGTSADFDFAAQVGVAGGNGDCLGVFFADASGNGIGWGLNQDGNYHHLRKMAIATWGTPTSSDVGFYDQPKYVRLKRVSGTLSYLWSMDGVTWQTYGIATEADTTDVAVIGYIIRVGAATHSFAEAGVSTDWFRVSVP